MEVAAHDRTQRHRGSVIVTHDVHGAIPGARAVYTDVGMSMGHDDSASSGSGGLATTRSIRNG
jgi:ornithine carbamoyltransferase